MQEKTASRVTADLLAAPPKGLGAKRAFASACDLQSVARDGQPEMAGLSLGQQTLSEILILSRTRSLNHMASNVFTLLSADVST